MLDCPNGEIRDLLPELLHDRLDAGARAAVVRHVDACADCTAELALLRSVRGVMREAPSVDLARIVTAVIEPGVSAPRTVPGARGTGVRRWVGWRAAAAIAMIAAGGTSLVVEQRGGVSVPVVDSVAILATRGQPVADAVADDAPVPATAAPALVVIRGSEATRPADAAPMARELAVAGTVGELSDSELALLLDDLEALDAVTPADAEAALVTPLAPARSEP